LEVDIVKAVPFAVLSIVFLAACDLKPPVATRAFTSGTGPVAEGLVYYLPRSLIRVRFSSNGLEILGEERVMDPRAKLVLETRPRAASRDDFDFTVAQGLLETATVDSEDQIPTIVDTALRGVRSAVRGEGNFARADRTETEEVVEFVFDPFDRSVVLPDGFEIDDVFPLDRTLPDRLARGYSRTGACVGEGRVCSGVETLVRVRVTGPGGEQVEQWIPVVDPTLAVAARLERNACADTKNSLTFTKGVVSRYDVTKPSELAECLSIPLDILSAIIAAPVDAITGRTARLEAERALLAERAEVLEQQKAVVDAQAALLEAQSAE
jgi:hypothetical protein